MREMILNLSSWIERREKEIGPYAEHIIHSVKHYEAEITALRAEAEAEGLTAPRLTPELIDAKIKSEQFHVFDGSCLTVCCLTLENGFTVTGESACASPENFNAKIGRKISRENARNKIWALEGYLLRERLAAA